MSFRFYRRISILPGVSLNLGKKGASVSVGPRGAKMTFGSRGVKSSVGIPGTGIRYETPYSKPGGTGLGDAVPPSYVLAVICAIVAFIFIKINAVARSPIITLLVIGTGALAVICFLIGLVSSVTRSSGSTASRGKYANAKAIKDDLYIDNLISASEAFYEFLRELNRSTRCRNMLKSFPGMDNVDDGKSAFSINPRLAFLVYCDLKDCYRELGHDPANLSGLEGVGYASLVILLIRRNFDLSGLKNLEIRKQLLHIVSDLYYSAQAEMDIAGHEEEFRFAFLFGTVKGEREWVQRYSTLMYRWASLIAKADGTVSEDESAVLAAILKMKEEKSDGNVRVTTREEIKRDEVAVPAEQNDSRVPENLDETMGELDRLIGLEPVKNDVHQLANFIAIQQKRRERGMKVAPVAYHCVFTGNPGTGKTTVARILADVYRQMGVVKKGHLVETDRSGLVAEYVGQTAVKTNKIIDSALDGVLFIDEAYTLVQGGSNDYGGEAIATLLKRMEDDRDRLVVILAGYTDEMKKFIDSNPGLQSRFNRYINFPDYSAEELSKIFLSIAEKSQYTCNADVRASLRDIMQAAVDTRDRCFGNGRYVRNLFERAIQRQAVRLSTVAPLTSEMLAELTLHDLGFSYE